MANVLYRKPKEGMLTGVCAGLAEYFGMSANVMRLIFIIATLASNGFAALLYFILAIILPVDESKRTSKSKSTASANVQRVGEDIKANYSSGKVGNFFGIGLLLLGAWLLLRQVLPEWTILQWKYMWPLLLIVFGAIILIRRKGDE